jgi:hypothetical protein
MHEKKEKFMQIDRFPIYSTTVITPLIILGSLLLNFIGFFLIILQSILQHLFQPELDDTLKRTILFDNFPLIVPK